MPTPFSPAAVTTDVVIFTIREQDLQVLLGPSQSAPVEPRWALPGRIVGLDEDLETSAVGRLEDATGVNGVYLEQLYTFGAPRRNPRQRVISVSYLALLPCERLPPRPASPAPSSAWYPLDDLPPLAFDHADIIEVAHQRLAAKLAYSTIAFQFLPEKFTLGELQAVYEIILGEPLDKRNFRKRIGALGELEETGEQRRRGKHRPARLYRVKNPGEVQIFK